MAIRPGYAQPLNFLFYTGVVPLAVGVLNPPNSDQTIWDVNEVYKHASMTINFPSAPTSAVIVLEGQLDQVNAGWVTIATYDSSKDGLPGAGQITVWGNVDAPYGALRARCTSVAGGSSPTVNVAVATYQTEPVITGPVTSNAVSTVTTSVRLDLGRGYSNISLMLNGTSTSYTAGVDASLDGVNWKTAVSAQTAQTTTPVFLAALTGTPYRYLRLNVSVIANGNVTLTVLSSPS